LPVPSRLLHGAADGEVFVLRVEGSSMMDIGMLNNDFIVVHSGLGYANGDIVVARIQGERATVKRIYKEKNRVRLQPENSTMQPIYAAFTDVEVVGKVIGLYRGF
ncbi:MAG: S24 family peptidase, partial [Eubacteriales bacterium]|nr:S24 family peptidase [Eubacteriales bacterium]